MTTAAPVELPPRGTAALGIELRITDCQLVGSPDIVVTVDSWRGVQTIVLPTTRLAHFSMGWRVATADDPDGIPSTRYVADLICTDP